MAGNSASKKVIYAALLGNLLIAVTKFAAALFTGSSSMFSEAIHSSIDTGNEVLLLYGYRRSLRPPDPDHPLGYGRELYFWSFIVAVLLFGLGAGLSIYEGVHRIANPRPIENVHVSYAVLGLALLFEGASWYVALRAFDKIKGRLGYLEAAQRSKDPPSFMVLFEDTAALIGIAVAGLGIFASDRLHMPIADGIASVIIGLVLAVIASIIAWESKELLIGERASGEIISSILSLAREQNGVEGANGVIAIHLAPDQIVVVLSLEFSDHLRTPEIEDSVSALEKAIRENHPEVISLFIKPQTPRSISRVFMLSGDQPGNDAGN